MALILQNGHGRKGHLGTGTYSLARRFVAVSADSVFEGSKTKVVLDPIHAPNKPCDYEESRNKYRFFNTLYPEAQVFYSENRAKNTYRLVLPDIPGTLYGDLCIQDEKEQIKLFLSTVVCLKNCHMRNIICMDVTPYNISYLAPTDANDIGKSYLIDGGFSSRPDRVLDPSLFKCDTFEIVQDKRFRHDYIAPECWYIENGPMTTHSMDIYSMATVLKKVFRPLSSELAPLLDACCSHNPSDRMPLDILEELLRNLLEVSPSSINTL